MIVQADIDFEEKIDKKTIDSITLYLAQNAPDVVSLLKGLKPAIKKGTKVPKYLIVSLDSITTMLLLLK